MVKLKLATQGTPTKEGQERAKQGNTVSANFNLAAPNTVLEKAFAPKSGRRTDRQGQRKVEKDQTRLHDVPLVNRTPDDEPPPVIVAIYGPPGVEKTNTCVCMKRKDLGGKKRRHL